jgi:hypothetical protein
MPNNNDSQVDETPYNHAKTLNFWKSREKSQSSNSSNPGPNDSEFITIDQALPQLYIPFKIDH